MVAPIIYVAHKFGGDPANLELAEKWCADLSLSFDGAFIAPWIPLCRHWPDDGDTRKRGLSLAGHAIHRCHGVILVGPEISTGMIEETQYINSARVFAAAMRFASADAIDAWTAARLREWLVRVSKMTIEEQLKIDRGANS